MKSGAMICDLLVSYFKAALLPLFLTSNTHFHATHATYFNVSFVSLLLCSLPTISVIRPHHSHLHTPPHITPTFTLTFIHLSLSLFIPALFLLYLFQHTPHHPPLNCLSTLLARSLSLSK